MSCKSRWSGPVDTELEALLRASVERSARQQFTVEFPPVNPIETGRELQAGGGDLAAGAIPPSGVADILSPTQVNGYLDCSARWKYKYVDELPDPANGKQARGTAVHGLVGYWFRQKLAGATPDAGTMAEAYEEIWDAAAAEATFSMKDNIEELKLSGAQLATKYIAERGNTINPTAIELKVQGVLGGVNVRGYVDLLCMDESGKVIDLKTTGRSPSGVSAGHALQLATYARLTPGASGLVQIDTVVANKTPKLVSVEYQIPEADITLTDRLYPAVQARMRDGFYLPNRGSIYCTQANCPFADQCCAEFGGIVE